MTARSAFDDLAHMPPDYDKSTYGEKIADIYDSLATPHSSAEHAAEFLSSVAGNRRVL